MGVEAEDKKEARLNCIHHSRSQMPYREVKHAPMVLPERVHHDDYVRHPVQPELLVPSVY